jgi:HK97 family phage prohead protease
MNNEFIKRNYPAEFRADSESGLIVGVPIVFDTPTDIGGMFQETICKGAIAERVLKNDVGFYFNHDLNSMRIARSIIPLDKLGGMEFELGEKEVKVRINANRKRSDANNLYLGIEDGTIDGMSFMFAVAEERWEDENTDYPKRFITRIEPIIEVSAVNYPAYKSTSINVARGDLLTESDKAVLGQVRQRAKAASENAAKKITNKYYYYYGGK